MAGLTLRRSSSALPLLLGLGLLFESLTPAHAGGLLGKLKKGIEKAQNEIRQTQDRIDQVGAVIDTLQVVLGDTLPSDEPALSDSLLAPSNNWPGADMDSLGSENDPAPPPEDELEESPDDEEDTWLEDDQQAGSRSASVVAALRRQPVGESRAMIAPRDSAAVAPEKVVKRASRH